MALSHVGVALACTEVALFEADAARALHPAPPDYKKCMGRDLASPPPPPPLSPSPATLLTVV